MNAIPYADALVRYQAALDDIEAAAKAQSHKNSEENRQRLHSARVQLMAQYNALLTQLQNRDVLPAIIIGQI